jgi:phosphate starvation-inducible membrane PsiE
MSGLAFFPALLFAGCSRAPSVDILGSFFPAWLLCFAIAVGMTAVIRLALPRLHVKVAMPALVYPSLAAFLTFALWLVFFY